MTRDLEAAGAEILAISPDSNVRSQDFAKRLKVNYRFLSDPDLAVTRQLGLVHAGGGEGGKDVPRPATIIVDANGVVRWVSISSNVQTRPDAAAVLRAVRGI